MDGVCAAFCHDTTFQGVDENRDIVSIYIYMSPNLYVELARCSIACRSVAAISELWAALNPKP